MTDPDTNRRFDRIETKIDHLTELVAQMARVEEKLVGVDGRLKRHEFRLDENEKKIDEVDAQARANSQFMNVGRAIVGSIWAASVGALVYIFTGGSDV